ncbi:MAG TPA: AMP-binding protein [Solirubrobacteraceae bacterium]|jgi:O-succinylbenzoic acid--CoA ligase
MVVEGWLERAAATHPARTAIETPQGERSYAELLADARVGAAELSSRGVGSGTHVAIALPPGLAFAQALHACLLLGAVAVPVDLRLSAPERKRIAEGAAVIIDGALDTSGSAVKAPHDGGHDLDATAVVIHTSGTTSAPRPVELTYGNFLWSALGSAVALGLDPQERWLCALPLSHVGGLSILMRSAIYGTTAVVHERFDAHAVLRALNERRITLVSLVATTLNRLLDAGLERPPMLRCALTGGGPVPTGLLQRAIDAGVPVSQTYGLTESCSQATTTPLAAIGDDRHVAGTPLFCTQVRIAADGEILLSGPTVAPASRDEEGWLRTGDLGSLDDGRLCVSGRASDTIISGGENVAPSEIEAVLEAHPGVLEAAVIGRPDPQWGQAITAIVVARPDANLQTQPLREHCTASLAPYKVPKQIVLADEPLPRTRSGKLLRRELV